MQQSIQELTQVVVALLTKISNSLMPQAEDCEEKDMEEELDVENSFIQIKAE